jgi:hypothetical protein
MKSLMSIPTFLSVIVVAIVIALPPLSPVPISASSDESETNAEQGLRQKNLGSGESRDFNCAENLIISASGVDCIPSGPAPPPPPPPETATLSVCKETSIENTSPRSFTFTVTGNNPSPQEFVGDDSDGCVDVTIGPGEYAVSEAVDLLAPGVEITGNCEQDPLNPQRATGDIQAGETQECRFINSPGAS